MFFQRIDGGINNLTYGDDHRYQFGFLAKTVQIHYESGTGPIYYSFNGEDDHGILDNITGAIETQVLQPIRAATVYLRRDATGDGSEVVQIMALEV